MAVAAALGEPSHPARTDRGTRAACKRVAAVVDLDEMARVKCKAHRPLKKEYSRTQYLPSGDGVLVCGASSCRASGLVWLTLAEERE